MLTKLLRQTDPNSTHSVIRDRVSPTAAARWNRPNPARHSLRRRKVHVAKLSRETENAVSLVLQPLDNQPIEYQAGQYLTHYFEIEGETVKRPYSLSCPEDAQRPVITVKHIPYGHVSGYVNETLKVGDTLEVVGPAGDFVLPEDLDARFVFVAGGAGITPCISLIETLLHKRPETEVLLLYSNRSEADIIFRERLAGLASEYSSLEVKHLLTRANGAWNGLSGRLNRPRVAELAGSVHDAHFYICGPAGLMESVTNYLRSEAIPADRIHVEEFTPAAREVAKHPDTPQQIHFKASGLTVTAEPGESVLEAGLKAGLALDFSCTVGGCASCKLRKTGGELVMDEPNCLAPDEAGQGYFLACSAYAASTLEVEA